MVNSLKNEKKKRGFTLIKLIIIITIIAMLTAIATPRFDEVRKDATFKSDIASAKTIANAATTLLADGKLTAASYDIDDNTTTGSTNKTEAYLQNSSKPKVNGYTKHVVTVSDKTVKVTTTNGTNTVDLFLVAATTAP